MDTWLPFGRMPRKGNHLASPGRLAGRLSSLHVPPFITKIIKISKAILLDISFTSTILCIPQFYLSICF